MKSRKIIKVLFKKELLDVLRDKKTVIMMLVVPVILYPLIFMVALGIMSAVQSNLDTNTYDIVVDTAADKGDFYDYLTKNSEGQEGSYTLNITSAEGGYDYMSDVKNEKYDVYVSAEYIYSGAEDMTGDEGSAADDTAYHEDDGSTKNSSGLGEYEEKRVRIKYHIYYLSSATNSNYASGIIYEHLKDMNSKMSRQILYDSGLDAEMTINPILFEYDNVASGKQSMGSMLGTVLPFLLVISLLMGIMYPAIDTTAGEKERGTLETLLTLPVTNRQMIVGKFLTVALIGIISAFLNILSMGTIAIYATKMLRDNGLINIGNVSFSGFIPVILIGIVAILAFSLFLSAITMCVTSFAKSYKEANNYITPLMLIVLFIGYIGFIPNMDLNGAVAMVPVANICLLIKELLVFKAGVDAVAMVLLSNVLYAFIAIMLLSRIYDSEQILFSDGRGSLQLFEKRSNLKKGGVPTVSDAWFVLLFGMVLVIYVGGMLQTKFGTGGIAGTQLIILMLPLSMAVYTKKDLKQTFSIKKPRLIDVVGSLILMIGCIGVGTSISVWLANVFKDSTAKAEKTISVLGEGNIWVSFIVVALMPAICEEMMFRGYVFSAAKARYKMAGTVIFVAIAFGVYHMSIARFFVTAMIGAAQALVVYYTGSIIPAMIMHCFNNAFSVIRLYHEEDVIRVMPFMDESNFGLGRGVLMFLIGAVLMAAGLMLVIKKHCDKKYPV
ncbi:sodium transport system permease protein [Eubacterium ruminantium]|nr:sodium transport system permease protein [Eubacterium ruminantium]